MTTWGLWKCPVCGHTWKGSIGWFIPKKGDEEIVKGLLTRLCGCTGEDVTEEDMKLMGGISTGPMRHPNVLAKLKKENKNEA